MLVKLEARALEGVKTWIAKDAIAMEKPAKI